MHESITKQDRNNINDPQKKQRLGTVSKNILLEGLNLFNGADKVVYEGIDHKSSDIFHLANQMRKENVDVVGDKPVKNDTGEIVNEPGGKAECVG